TNDQIEVHADTPWLATAVAMIVVAATIGFLVVTVRQTLPPRRTMAILMSGIAGVALGGLGTVVAADGWRTPVAVSVSGALTAVGLVAIGYVGSSRGGLTGSAVRGARL